MSMWDCCLGGEHTTTTEVTSPLDPEKVPVVTAPSPEGADAGKTAVTPAAAPTSTAPPAALSAFDAMVPMKGGNLGLDIDLKDPMVIFISKVNAGAVADYNKTVSEDKHIRPGDYMVRINDTPNTDAMVEQVKMAKTPFMRDSTLKLSIQHPTIFEVIVHKKDGALGLTLNDQDTGFANSLLVVKVGEGTVRRSAKATSTNEVREGDRIVKVNGKEAEWKEMLQLIKDSQGEVKLTISRH